MPGSAIQTFNDFMSSTGPTYLTSVDKVINEAVRNTYMLSRLLKEKTTEKLVQSGTEIRDVIMFDDASTYDHYLPNDTFAWRNPQVQTTAKSQWRFSIDHMAWTDQEIILNGGGGGNDALKVQFKSVKRQKERRLWTSMFNGYESDLWKTPFGNSANMEDDGGALPYSLPCFISEVPDINNNTGVARGGCPLGWTQVQRIVNGSSVSITTNESRWTNQISFYDPTPTSSDPNLALASYAGVKNVRDGGTSTYTAWIGGLLSAFDEMFLKIKFMPPQTKQEYFEKAELNRQMILCSRWGMTMYQQALRHSNQNLVTPQDPAYNAPAYSGIQLMYCSDLDTAAIFPGGATPRTAYNTAIATSSTTAGQTENGATVVDPGPRFWWVNGNYLTPIFHSQRYMEKHDVVRHPNQPFTWVQPVDSWWNLFCNSRQRQGIVAPLAI